MKTIVLLIACLVTVPAMGQDLIVNKYETVYETEMRPVLVPRQVVTRERYQAFDTVRVVKLFRPFRAVRRSWAERTAARLQGDPAALIRQRHFVRIK